MEKEIRMWRTSTPEKGPGLYIWFDPYTELLTLRDLTEDEKIDTLDKLSSVSDLSRPRVKVGEQMDAFWDRRDCEPSPSFVDSMWEGGSEDG